MGMFSKEILGFMFSLCFLLLRADKNIHKNLNKNENVLKKVEISKLILTNNFKFNKVFNKSKLLFEANFNKFQIKNKIIKDKFVLIKSLNSDIKTKNISILLLGEQGNNFATSSYLTSTYFSNKKVFQIKGFLISYFVNQWYSFNYLIIQPPSLILNSQIDFMALKATSNFARYLDIDSMHYLQNCDSENKLNKRLNLVNYFKQYFQKSLLSLNMSHILFKESTLSGDNKSLEEINYLLTKLKHSNLGSKLYVKKCSKISKSEKIVDLLRHTLVNLRFRNSTVFDKIPVIFELNLKANVLSIFSNILVMVILELLIEKCSQHSIVSRNKLVKAIKDDFYK